MLVVKEVTEHSGAHFPAYIGLTMMQAEQCCEANNRAYPFPELAGLDRVLSILFVSLQKGYVVS